VAGSVRGWPKPKVYFEEWDDPLISGIGWVSELIEIAGGEEVFPELRKQRAAKDRIVSPQDVIAAAPDVIFASWCGKKVVPTRLGCDPGGTKRSNRRDQIGADTAARTRSTGRWPRCNSRRTGTSELTELKSGSAARLSVFYLRLAMNDIHSVPLDPPNLSGLRPRGTPCCGVRISQAIREPGRLLPSSRDG
jgi:hypothetical protein